MSFEVYLLQYMPLSTVISFPVNIPSIYGSGGMPALFVGSLARVTWLLPFTTIYLGVYEASKRLLLQQQIAAKQARVQ